MAVASPNYETFVRAPTTAETAFAFDYSRPPEVIGPTDGRADGKGRRRARTSIIVDAVYPNTAAAAA